MEKKYTLKQIKEAIINLDNDGRFFWYSIGKSSGRKCDSEGFDNFMKEFEVYIENN